MTLHQFTNLDTRDKISTLNSLYKGLIKFDTQTKEPIEGDFEDLMNNMGMNM